VLVAALPGLSKVESLAKAALDSTIEYVKVDEVPEPGIKYALELTSPGLSRRVAVLAELAGRPSGGEEKLSLRPLGKQGASDLRAFLAERSGAPPVQVEEADPFIGRLIGGKYEVESLISSGSAGVVYRARHLLLDRPIALKLLHDELARDPMFTAHFNGEARAASRLDHPNICRVFDFGEDDDGILYIVMELLEGKELCDVVDTEGAFSLERILDTMVQVCAALSLAHERGIVHRDVKAENILAISTVDDDGQPREVVKVCDFGLAMSTNLSSGEQFATFRGTCGTPAYMPPEQVRGETLDARADVYACGVLMYLLATGRLPFEDQDQDRILAMQLKQEPVRPTEVNPNVDSRLEAIILRAMSKQREGRYGNARELRSALRQLSRAQTDRGQAPPSTPDRDSLIPKAPSPVPPPAQPISGPESQRRHFELSRSAGPLEDPTSGLIEVVARLANALAHSPSGGELAALDNLLSGRRSIVFLRADPTKPDLLVQDAKIAPRELRSLVPAASASVLAKALFERGVVTLTLREGIEAAELVTTLTHLRAARVPPLALPHTLIISDDTRLGRVRALPWLVDLAATRIAVALLTPQNDPSVRAKTVETVLRPLQTPAEVRTLLESSDLIGAAAQISAWDVACAVGDGIAQPVCARLVAALAQELLNQSQAVPLDLIRMLARRLSRERDATSDELLRNLLARQILTPDDVPEELCAEKLAEQCAADILAAPARALTPLESAPDEASYARAVGLVEQAMRILLKQGRLVPFAHAFRVLAQHASELHHPFRSSIAARAVVGLQDPAFLERVALVLLRGPVASHEAAQSVLSATGRAGGQALCTIRLRSGNDLDLGARKRFAAAVRLCGPAAGSAISHALRQAGPESLDVFVVEDLLRAVPDGMSDDIGATVQRLTQHFAPQVRRAALGALTAIWGARVRQTLLKALGDQDEGVRLSALVGIQRLGDLDYDGVTRVAELMANGGDEIRAAAAAAISGASHTARPEAITILSKALLKQKISRVFRLGDDGESAVVVEATARALVTLGGPDARLAVEQRASKADGELKRRLLAMLAT
jgi:serine/threonine protein kinase